MECNHAAYTLTLGSLDVASESMTTKDDPKGNTSTAESMDTTTTASKTATEGSQVSEMIIIIYAARWNEASRSMIINVATPNLTRMHRMSD